VKGDLDQVSFQPPHGAALELNRGRKRERERMKENERERETMKKRTCPTRVCLPTRAATCSACAARVGVHTHTDRCGREKWNCSGAGVVARSCADILMSCRMLSEVQLKRR